MQELEAKILLVSEGPHSPQPFVRGFRTHGFETRVIGAADRIEQQISAYGPDLLLMEIIRPGSNWRHLLEARTANGSRLPVILIATLETLAEAVEAVKNGVDDFLIQPLGFESLLFRVRKALQTFRAQTQIEALSQEIKFRRSQDVIVGASPKIQQLLSQVMKVAVTNLNVLITGETGTGKELAARAIHSNSLRSDGPFVVVNCSAMPEGLFENLLFGHMKGAYTGADQTTRGFYEQAAGGTLFLDEIGEVPLSIQAKLLRVLETNQFQRLGGSETIHVDVRTLAATNRDLQSEIAEGRFREDLFFRLNVFPIHVPALKERKEDIPQLVGYFLKRFKDELNPALEGFSTSAIQKLMFYDWPGNVRELENYVRQAMINAPGPRVYREDIDLSGKPGKPVIKSYREARQEFEKNYLTNVLAIAGGNVSEAARLAKKDRKDFYDAMRKYGLRSGDFRKI